ncbi:hypothetical protein ACFQVD_34085 [Streptosporangium amethystogenes subsp. fukuiense]|uniref:Uncharacterized protein n=1 Tax=Streptosporangium amethystogenes subsp. fukuiense TaxID=698418 RepID=A0ABW2TA69_9ACTN
MRFKLAGAAVSAVLASTALLVSPTTEQAHSAAPSCVRPPHARNGEGAGTMRGDFNLKTAPYAHCGNVKRLSRSTAYTGMNTGSSGGGFAWQEHPLTDGWRMTT